MKPLSSRANVLGQYGFKQINHGNLFERDDHPSYPSRLHGEKWVKECLKPKLNASVPEDVAFLFEMARGAMIYGLFFLPLLSLAAEEGFRVLEAGVRSRCKQLGLMKPKSGKATAFPEKRYADMVAALQKAGEIPEKDSDVWKGMVYLRNKFSHGGSPTPRARHDAISQMSFIAELLNRLFE